MTVTGGVLEDWIVEALNAMNGRGSPVTVSKHIWEHHRLELERSGDMFYKWQYDMRWAAQRLRDTNKLLKTHDRHFPWRLAK